MSYLRKFKKNLLITYNSDLIFLIMVKFFFLNLKKEKFVIVILNFLSAITIVISPWILKKIVITYNSNFKIFI
jgi:hypothetical protein